MITGLPLRVFQIGIQFEIFVINNNSNKDDEIKIASNIASFSYNSPIYKLSEEKTNILFDLLRKYKSLSILCQATIIQKCDQYGDYVQDIYHPESYKDRHEIDQESIMDTIEKIEKNKKQPNWMQYPSEQFIWKISDDNLFHEIQSPDFRVFHSKIFKLLNNKWFIAIQKERYYDDDVVISAFSIYVDCVLERKESITCRIELEIPELHDPESYDCNRNLNTKAQNFKAIYYETFKYNISPRDDNRYFGPRRPPVSNTLFVNQSLIEHLETLSIQVKISKISVINESVSKDQNDADIAKLMEKIDRLESNNVIDTIADNKLLLVFSFFVTIIAILLVKA